MRLVWRALFLTVVLLGYWTSTVQPSVTGPAADDVPVVVRINFSDDAQLRQLAATLDVWEVHRADGYLVALVWPDQKAALEDAGYVVEPDPAKTALLTAPRPAAPGQTSGIPGFPCYRTVEETYATAEAIAANYPDLATWIDIGDSWEKTVDPAAGYDLMVLRLTNATIPGPKPKLFVMSSVHAREYTPAELSTRFAEYLVGNYGLDANVTWLLDYHEIHLLLIANPDGRKYAEQGLYWRKNTDNNFCTNTDLRGVDLNRNFAFQWDCCGGSSPSECNETFHGPLAASEPEVQAIQNYLRDQFPDQRGASLSAAAPLTATGVFLDIHSYSELILWPWGFQLTPAPNANGLTVLGQKLAYFNGYEPYSAYHLYPVDGDTIDFAYGELGLASYVFELGTAFFQGCTVFEDTILPDNLQALLYAAQVARTPYVTPAGPDVTGIALQPQGAELGATVQISAQLEMRRASYGEPASADGDSDDQIAAAEFYVDVPPWVTTTMPVSYTLSAADGAFDAAEETVVGVIDTQALAPGRHTVFVRGRSTTGAWGPFSASFMYLVGPSEVAVIDGYVRDAATNAPLEASISAGVFETQTEPATGYYALHVISGTYDLGVVGPSAYITATSPAVTAYTAQTVREDVYLYASCDIFTDDVESGNVGWTTAGPWAITDEAAHSASHSWTDSPGNTYAERTNAYLVSPILDLSENAGTHLSFWHVYDLAPDDDSAFVEYSLDGGDTWTVSAVFQGQNPITWTQQVLSLTALDGQPDARVRFALSSGPRDTGDGWHIDDIALASGGPACVTPLAPQAEFTHTQAWAGAPVRFTNLTWGTPPFETRWDFGDGYGASTKGDPTYIYHKSGTMTVTLSVTNTVGSATISRPITVGLLDLPFDVYLPLILRE